MGAQTPKPPIYFAPLVYHSEADVILTFYNPQTGSGERVYSYTVTDNTWTSLTCPGMPRRDYFYPPVYDSKNNVTLFFGGSIERNEGLNETWD